MKAKTITIALEDKGSYLGMEKGCFMLKDKKGEVQRYPLFENEIGEIVVTSGNLISTGVLACCGFWAIPVVVKTSKGDPVAILRSIDDSSHVETRVKQYEALTNGKGIEIAKNIVLSKIEGQNLILNKYHLEELDLSAIRDKVERVSGTLTNVRKRLLPIEGRASDIYFTQIFELFHEELRVENRKTYKAYDGLNNCFNLIYTLLKYRVYSAVLGAHLEPFLGFVHSDQFGKPSLVCDLMELWRYLCDDFLIGFSRNLKMEDFVLKTEWFSASRKGKRQVLSEAKSRELSTGFDQYLEKMVDVPRIRFGKRQSLETLISEESMLFAKYLRSETDSWVPRIASV